jgi:hypothetical protein
MQLDRFACPTLRQHKGSLLLTSGSVAAAAGWRVGGTEGRWGCGSGLGRGTPPPTVGDQPRQAAEDEADHRLIGRTGWQVDLERKFTSAAGRVPGSKG